MNKIILAISAAYLIISLALVLTRKHGKKFLGMLPPICQVASVLLIDSMKLQLPVIAVLFLLNLAILIWVDMTEKKEMGLIASEEEDDWNIQQPDTSWESKKPASFAVNTDFLAGPSGLSNRESEFTHLTDVAPELPVMEDRPLIRPEVENRPINEVAPVEQEIFSASEGEVEQMIDQMLESGDMANAKRYLRMLAFFGKDEPSRKLAERKLAEISAAN